MSEGQNCYPGGPKGFVSQRRFYTGFVGISGGLESFRAVSREFREISGDLWGV